MCCVCFLCCYDGLLLCSCVFSLNVLVRSVCELVCDVVCVVCSCVALLFNIFACFVCGLLRCCMCCDLHVCFVGCGFVCCLV